MPWEILNDWRGEGGEDTEGVTLLKFSLNEFLYHISNNEIKFHDHQCVLYVKKFLKDLISPKISFDLIIKDHQKR